ncbi:8013_t:CDS:2 [Funneliformis geosporum]|uniref:8013_t:CDS:1 n=1 Tax=Funneliformis geosporum TaxID=1117311 RepID=A0A9W4WW50_9GLOM|nr:8013_t:CDS:2 [Funneliformis geosporum]
MCSLLDDPNEWRLSGGINYELSISLNYSRFEVLIPLNQVIKFHLSQNQTVQLELKKNFTRYYYRNYRGTHVSIQEDPTNGKFKDANFFIFVPADWVDINTLKFFVEGVNELLTHKVKPNSNNHRFSDINSLVYIGDEKDQIKSFQNLCNDDELQMRCNFLSGSRILRVSKETPFQEILTMVRERFKVDIDPNVITYKNQTKDMINLLDEEDWNAAKWEMNMTKIQMIDLYFFPVI